MIQEKADSRGKGYLEGKLVACPEALVIPPDNLEVIISQTYKTKAGGSGNQYPGIGVFKIHP
ncbi:hypothetical protein BMS3Bbin07_01560 [bacterium BMS3Bbin07]|nr:hypothetical protein BMS3Bbin07_01560 [bacterium BMS3Bbin07]